MTLEIWYYLAPLPNGNAFKSRPVLVIGNDSDNGLKIVDIHYSLISSSSEPGKYDVVIDEEMAKELGLSRASVIKTTKLYTGSDKHLERKICTLPHALRDKLVEQYRAYQNHLLYNLTHKTDE